ncbi:MAG: hypothetical protein ABI675_25230 [Chitinophagaceae bacterium]
MKFLIPRESFFVVTALGFDAGFSTGSIGFQFCHYHAATTVDIKSLCVREAK